MLDTIPRRVSLEYWFRRKGWSLLAWFKLRQEQIISITFYAIPIALAGLYYPVYGYLTHQEARVVINVSNLTVFYVIFLFYIANFVNQMLNKYTKNKPYWYRLVGLFIFIIAIVAFLDAIGMRMRWD